MKWTGKEGQHTSPHHYEDWEIECAVCRTVHKRLYPKCPRYRTNRIRGVPLWALKKIDERFVSETALLRRGR